MAFVYIMVCLLVVTIGLLIASIVLICIDRAAGARDSLSVAQKAANYTERNKTTRKGAVVLVGDSITEMYPVEKFYEGYNVVNRGIGSDTVCGVLARLQSNVIDIAPSKIFLMIGTNDLSNSDSPQHIIANIKKIAQEIKEKLPSAALYIESIYPITRLAKIDYFNTPHRSNDIIDGVNDSIKEYCEASGNAIYVDVNSALKGSDGRLKRECTTEGLHISLAGYAVVTSVLMPYIEQ